MNPYEVLGVSASASIEEVEARYRLLVREYHPDLHQGEGPESIAACEAMTRNLNSAMMRIRDAKGSYGPGSTSRSANGFHDARREGSSGQWVGDNPFYRPPGDAAADGADTGTRGPDPDEDRDWFGDRPGQGVNDPVPCPFCNRGFLRLVDYELHLQQAHHFKFVAPAPKRPSQSGSLIGLIAWMRLIPAWFVVLAAFGLWKVAGFYAFVGALVFLLLVVWTQTNPRFRRYRR